MMLFSALIMSFSLTVFAQVDCVEKFDNRHEGQASAQEAFDCYKKQSQTETVRETKALALSQMSYLKFFIAEYHLDKKSEALFEGMQFAEEALLLFGPKYSLQTYNELSASEKKVLAQALYNYGLTTARYIDIQGQWEAIKRMEDIKKSMNSIIRMKEEAVAFYGAHRTLGIFHLKVPYIAGGRMELARNFLATAIKETSYDKDLSSYPANNVAYADLMFKDGKDQEGCYHLNLVAKITDAEAMKMQNGLYLETLQSVKDAKKLIQSRKCSTQF